MDIYEIWHLKFVLCVAWWIHVKDSRLLGVWSCVGGPFLYGLKTKAD